MRQQTLFCSRRETLRDTLEFPRMNRESLALIKACFVTNDTLAFIAIVSAADRGRNRPGVFVYIIHYIEPSGRQPFGVHKGTWEHTRRAARDQHNILGGLARWPQYKELGARIQELGGGCARVGTWRVPLAFRTFQRLAPLYRRLLAPSSSKKDSQPERFMHPITKAEVN